MEDKQEKNAELSDERLEQVAGGYCGDTIRIECEWCKKYFDPMDFASHVGSCPKKPQGA